MDVFEPSQINYSIDNYEYFDSTHNDSWTPDYQYPLLTPKPAPPAVLDVVLGYLYFILTAVTSILSIIGCLIIIFSYIFIKVCCF